MYPPVFAHHPQKIEHGEMELSLSLQGKSMFSSFVGLKPTDFHCKDKNSLKQKYLLIMTEVSCLGKLSLRQTELLMIPIIL